VRIARSCVSTHSPHDVLDLSTHYVLRVKYIEKYLSVTDCCVERLLACLRLYSEYMGSLFALYCLPLTWWIDSLLDPMDNEQRHRLKKKKKKKKKR
jgi:hypothetical protein